jgi:inner membrane protein
LAGLLFLATAAHGVLDAMTTGGLGVAFFSPWNPERYFFGFRPIAVSPIGIKAFFSGVGLRVLGSEALWVGLPGGVALGLRSALKPTTVRHLP